MMMARRGRPPGSDSWARNPDNVAAHYAEVMLELWLGAAPVEALKYLMSPALCRAELVTLLEECWSKQSKEQRHTVPVPIKRDICKLAIEYVDNLYGTKQKEFLAINCDQLTDSINTQLRNRGLSDDQIAANFKRFEKAQRRAEKKWRRPNLTKVIEIVNRRAPANTLRRKAMSRKSAAQTDHTL